MQIVHIKMSEKISLDLKVAPGVLITSQESVKEENPNLPEALKSAFRERPSPEFSWTYGIVLRYTVQDGRRRRGG